MVRVVVAEKPSVGRDIAEVLGCRTRRDGYIEGNGVRVTWARGHLVKFAEPEGYEGWQGSWSEVALPMVPERWKLVADGDGAAQLKVVSKLLREASEVVCATDAGREGEHIFRLIAEYVGLERPVKRLWISSLTREAILEGFGKLHEAREFEPLAASARVRDQADWLVGMNLTRAYTLHADVLCSVGRVQTPTLAMVVGRDRDIEGFVKVEFCEVVAHFEGFDAVHVFEGEEEGKWETRLGKEQAQAVMAACWPGHARVRDVQRRERRVPPPYLFDLTGLQQAANKRFGWTAAKVLEVAQSLYEAKVLSYPRTSSRHLPEDMRAGFPGVLEKLRGGGVAGAAQAAAELQAGRTPGKRFVDKLKVTDHHAIVPTGVLPQAVANFNERDAGVRLFGLVAERYVTMFLPECVREETTAWLDLNGFLFRAKGVKTLVEGWRGVGRDENEEGEEQEGTLPQLFPDSNVAVQGVEVLDKETRPPARYSEATLLAAMKDAGRRLEGEDAQALAEAGGIGTPATRASIIETLLRRGYLRRDGKRLLSTAVGQGLIDMVAPGVKNVSLTAAWERRLGEIERTEGAEAERRAAEFYDDVVSLVESVVPGISRSEARMPLAEGTALGRCPVCGKAVRESPKSYSCVGWRQEPKCDFKIWKSHLNKKISARQAKDILAGKRVLVRQWRKRDGSTFDARVFLKLGGYNNLGFEFFGARPASGGHGRRRAEPSRPVGAR